jgi:hypothetical protein
VLALALFALHLAPLPDDVSVHKGVVYRWLLSS